MCGDKETPRPSVQQLVRAGVRQEKVGEGAHVRGADVARRQRVQRLATHGLVRVHGETHPLAKQTRRGGHVSRVDRHVKRRVPVAVGRLEKLGDVLGGELFQTLEAGDRVY